MELKGETKTLAESAKELYLNRDYSKVSTEILQEIRSVDCLRAEAYVLGGIRAIKSIQEIIAVGCDDLAFEQMLMDRMELLMGNYEIEPEYNVDDVVSYKRGNIEGVGRIRSLRRDNCLSTLESRIRYFITGAEGLVFEGSELKKAE